MGHNNNKTKGKKGIDFIKIDFIIQQVAGDNIHRIKINELIIKSLKLIKKTDLDKDISIIKEKLTQSPQLVNRLYLQILSIIAKRPQIEDFEMKRRIIHRMKLNDKKEFIDLFNNLYHIDIIGRNINEKLENYIRHDIKNENAFEKFHKKLINNNERIYLRIQLNCQKEKEIDKITFIDKVLNSISNAELPENWIDLSIKNTLIYNGIEHNIADNITNNIIKYISTTEELEADSTHYNLNNKLDEYTISDEFLSERNTQIQLIVNELKILINQPILFTFYNLQLYLFQNIPENIFINENEIQLIENVIFSKISQYIKSQYIQSDDPNNFNFEIQKIVEKIYQLEDSFGFLKLLYLPWWNII